MEGWLSHVSFQRPSVNTYALPQVLYRCMSVDLQEGDCNSMTSSIKSWMYDGLPEKPEEISLYRQREKGGIGLHHLKSKARAILIKSFMETAL